MFAARRALFSLLFLCAVAHAPAFAAEQAVVIPPPAVDNPKSAGPLQTAVRWPAKHRAVRSRERRSNGSRGVNRDHIRSAGGLVWPDTAGVLLGCARPHATQSARS